MNIRAMANICAKLEADFLQQFGPDESEPKEEPHFPINQDDEE